MISSKLATAAWFAKRPSFWPHGLALAARKFAPDLDTPSLRSQATDWARHKAVTVPEALMSVGFDLPHGIPKMPVTIIEAAEKRAATAEYKMGGAGDLDLVYAATSISGARSAVETGVAYGWSSLAILSALKPNGGRLVSVDMPYVKAGNEPWVGVVVPDELRGRWTLIREPDRNGLRKALNMFPGGIDLAHYDSDKSYAGRMFAYPLIWSALRPGGLFLSDDIQDNFAFADFVASRNVDFAVTSSAGKFAAIARKP